MVVLYMGQPQNVFYRNWTLSNIKVLRIALAVFRTSPVTSLYAKAQERSLSNRRRKLSMNYVLKRKSCPNNPAYSCVFEPPNSELSEKSYPTLPPSLRILSLFEDS